MCCQWGHKCEYDTTPSVMGCFTPLGRQTGQGTNHPSFVGLRDFLGHETFRDLKKNFFLNLNSSSQHIVQLFINCTQCSSHDVMRLSVLKLRQYWVNCDKKKRQLCLMVRGQPHQKSHTEADSRMHFARWRGALQEETSAYKGVQEYSVLLS